MFAKKFIGKLLPEKNEIFGNLNNSLLCWFLLMVELLY